MEMQANTKRYYESFIMWNPSSIEMIQQAETKGEKKSLQERVIKEVKSNYYPKVCEREIIKYIKSI